MDRYPRLLIDLKKIESNTRTIVDMAKNRGIGITAVTKATCADPNVAFAMLKGGAESLGDSRVQNLKRLRDQGIGSPLMLLRTPMLSEVNDVVRFSDISLNTELRVMKALSIEARTMETEHNVVPMVEMGDLREGIIREDLPGILETINKLDGIELFGLGMNLACFGGVVPTKEKMNEFEELVGEMEDRIGIELRMVSGGNSANIPYLMETEEPGRTNNLRIGEGILLGLETVNRTPIPGTHQDAFVLEAEIIEKKEKPSIPDGTISQNAFGETPEFEDMGELIRGIAAVGRQDTILEDLTPLSGEVEVLGGSSDHLLLRLNDEPVNVGDSLRFIPAYGALVHLFTSKYVSKVYV
ncbi:MAG: alanine/ornithine racemase family PLP-dependent enzyme [Thermoplasmatota archaeon]